MLWSAPCVPELPDGARLHRWHPDAKPEENPYLGLLGLADGFVVTADSASMVVEVELDAENMLTGERRLCTRGKFNMVALDEDGKPTPVPKLTRPE